MFPKVKSRVAPTKFSPFRKFSAFLVAGVMASAVVAPGSVSAGVITGNLIGFTEYTPVNLSASGIDAYTIYGGIETFGDPSDLTYKPYGALSTSAFSALSSTGTVFGNYGGGGGRIKYQYENALGTYAAQGTGASVDATAPKAETTAPSLTLTHTLLGNNEVIRLVIQNNQLDETTGGSTLSASLNSVGSYFLTTDNFFTNNADGIQTLELNVSGNIGDIFTFTISAPGATSFHGVSISSASLSVSAIPEPSTLTLVFGAGALAILRRRRKSIA